MQRPTDDPDPRLACRCCRSRCHPAAPARIARRPHRGDYPALALIDDVAGTTAFALSVGSDGRASNCRVTASSGSALLDDTTCKLLLRRARFAPATANGKAVAGEWKSRVRWELPAYPYAVIDPRFDGPAKRSARAGEGLAALEPALTAVALSPATSFVIVDIDRTGVVTACKGDGGTAPPDRACALLRGKDLFVPGFDGEDNATNDRVRVKIRW
jgi:TonB family protein